MHTLAHIINQTPPLPGLMQWACYKKASAHGSRVAWTSARRNRTEHVNGKKIQFQLILSKSNKYHACESNKQLHTTALCFYSWSAFQYIKIQQNAVLFCDIQLLNKTKWQYLLILIKAATGTELDVVCRNVTLFPTWKHFNKTLNYYSEWVSRFLMAHKHIIGHSVP